MIFHLLICFVENKKRRGSVEEIPNGMMYLPKKARVCFSEEQKDMLRDAYNRDPYPNQATIEQLAETIGVGVKTVVNWFHNHRMRAKQQQHLSGQSPDGSYDSNMASVKSDSSSDDSSNGESNCTYRNTPMQNGSNSTQWMFPTFEVIQPRCKDNMNSSDHDSNKESVESQSESDCEHSDDDHTQSEKNSVTGAACTGSRRKSAKPQRIPETSQVDQTSISSDSERCDSHQSVDVSQPTPSVTPEVNAKIDRIQKALQSSEMDWEEPDREENINKLEKSITNSQEEDWEF